MNAGQLSPQSNDNKTQSYERKSNIWYCECKKQAAAAATSHHDIRYRSVCMYEYTVYVVCRLPRLGLIVVCVLFRYQQPEFSYKSKAEGRRVDIIAYFESDKKFP